jgi:hypothetical protein
VWSVNEDGEYLEAGSAGSQLPNDLGQAACIKGTEQDKVRN